jgi:uncharacterized membrane protein/predicted DsbA family dithiol-disulfide isomerase
MTARVLGFRFLALTGLAFASILLTDDLSRVPSFCPFQSGCATVTTSAFGRPFGIPLSAIGMVAFAAFFGLTLLPGTKACRFLGPLALAAGIAGLLLVSAQFLVLKHACRFCLVVDAAAILLAAAEFGLPRPAETKALQRKRRWGWAGAAICVAAAPPLWVALRPPPPVPSEVRQTWQAGKLNVVEITDFTCPFCRRTHEALEELQRIREGEIHIVRFVTASPADESALAATRTYECAVRQGDGERMAREIFKSKDFSSSNLREVAQTLHLALARYDRDLQDGNIDLEIKERRKWIKAQPFAGLPQVWVQDLLLIGEQTPESLTAAARRVR